MSLVVSSSRLVSPPATLCGSSLLDRPTRSFASKNKTKKNKMKAAIVEDSDSDDSDWEDDQEIPFGQPMVPRKVDEEEDAAAAKKNALQEAIDCGLNDLKATSTMISNQKDTKKPLFHKSAIGEDEGPTKQQLAEGNRVLNAAQQCLEEFEQKGKAHPLSVHGEPILILKVHVNSNLREAIVYWGLPIEVWMDAPPSHLYELKERMQERLEGPAGSFLQGRVHTKLRSYYPPKLRFEPAPDMAMEEMLLFD